MQRMQSSFSCVFLKTFFVQFLAFLLIFARFENFFQIFCVLIFHAQSFASAIFEAFSISVRELLECDSGSLGPVEPPDGSESLMRKRISDLEEVRDRGWWRAQLKGKVRCEVSVY